MSRYRCLKCNNVITTDVRLVGIHCDRCGSRMFYKGRSSIKKVIKPR